MDKGAALRGAAHLHREARALALRGLAQQREGALDQVVLGQHLLQAAALARLHVQDEGQGGREEDASQAEEEEGLHGVRAPSTRSSSFSG